MKKILKFLKPYRFAAIISPLLMIGEVLADLLLPRYMSVIVDCGITHEKTIAEIPWANAIMKLLFADREYGSLTLIITFGVLMLLTVLVGGVFGVSCAYFSSKASQGLGNDLRCAAYEKVMSLSIEQTDKFTTGSLITRMTNDITLITEFVGMLLRMVVRSPMFLIGGIVMLLSMQASFGLILVCGLPIMVITLVAVLSRAVPLYSKVQKNLDRVNTVVQENVSGARVVKAYVMEEHEYERFRKANEELMQTNYRVQKIIATIHPVLTVVMQLSIIAVILIGGNTIRIGADVGMSTGSIMAAITYITQVLMSVMMLSHIFQSISRAISSAKRVEEVLSSEPVIKGGSLDLGDGELAISMRGVSFSYPNTSGLSVLHDIDLDVKKGETLAIIGATGCGKTTLVSLIPRFYDVTEGEILINGTPIKELELSSLRSRIAFVMQKSELFSESVSSNIRWGKSDASDEEVKGAAEVAQADEFISSMPESYDTLVSEKGTSLSGGQKQRLSIARALVRRPEILILDDSTSALDLNTEAKLKKALRQRLADTTVIMIAQRIASVKDADRIAVLENGTVTAIGTHDELMASSATYRDIYDSQNKNGGALI